MRYKDPKERGALHLIPLFLIGLVLLGLFFVAAARDQFVTMENEIAQQDKRIKDLEAKVSILQLKNGL